MIKRTLLIKKSFVVDFKEGFSNSRSDPSSLYDFLSR